MSNNRVRPREHMFLPFKDHHRLMREANEKKRDLNLNAKNVDLLYILIAHLRVKEESELTLRCILNLFSATFFYCVL